MGFEPTAPCGITGFQDRLLKPLGHLSNMDYYIIGSRFFQLSKQVAAPEEVGGGHHDDHGYAEDGGKAVRCSLPRYGDVDPPQAEDDGGHGQQNGHGGHEFHDAVEVVRDD